MGKSKRASKTRNKNKRKAKRKAQRELTPRRPSSRSAKITSAKATENTNNQNDITAKAQNTKSFVSRPTTTNFPPALPEASLSITRDFDWPTFDAECCQECGITIPLHITAWVLDDLIVCEECFEILDTQRKHRGDIILQPRTEETTTDSLEVHAPVAGAVADSQSESTTEHSNEHAEKTLATEDAENTSKPASTIAKLLVVQHQPIHHVMPSIAYERKIAVHKKRIAATKEIQQSSLQELREPLTLSLPVITLNIEAPIPAAPTTPRDQPAPKIEPAPLAIPALTITVIHHAMPTARFVSRITSAPNATPDVAVPDLKHSEPVESCASEASETAIDKTHTVDAPITISLPVISYDELIPDASTKEAVDSGPRREQVLADNLNDEQVDGQNADNAQEQNTSAQTQTKIPLTHQETITDQAQAPEPKAQSHPNDNADNADIAIEIDPKENDEEHIETTIAPTSHSESQLEDVVEENEHSATDASEPELTQPIDIATYSGWLFEMPDDDSQNFDASSTLPQVDTAHEDITLASPITQKDSALPLFNQRKPAIAKPPLPKTRDNPTAPLQTPRLDSPTSIENYLDKLAHTPITDSVYQAMQRAAAESPEFQKKKQWMHNAQLLCNDWLNNREAG